MANVLVINATSFETRVALVENGTIAEYYVERKREKGIVGNIYKGRVLRVLPGMQAAFVDLGTDKAGFLYVNDIWYDPAFSEETFELTEGEWGEDSDLPEEQVLAEYEEELGDTQEDAEAAATRGDPSERGDENVVAGTAAEAQGGAESDEPSEPDEADANVAAGRGQAEEEGAEVSEKPSGRRRRRRGAPAEARAAEVEPTEVEPTEVEPTEVEPTEVEPTEVEPTEVEPTEVEAVEEKPVEVEVAEPEAAEPEAAEPEAAESEAAEPEAAEPEAAEPEAAESEAAEPEAAEAEAAEPEVAESEAAESEAAEAEAAESEDTESEDTESEDTESEVAESEDTEDDGEESDEDEDDEGDSDDEDGEEGDEDEESELAAGEPSAEGEESAESEQRRRGRRRRRRRGRTHSRPERAPEARKEARKELKKNDRKDKGRRTVRQRAQIQDLIKEGQEIVVQVAKAPIGSKGARITTHVSLPGRHLVFMPTVDHVGISRRIASDKERRRLRQIIEEIRPPGTGFIVRTVADGVDRDKLVADARFLLNLWADINKRKDRVSAPALLHPDLDLVLRATRDLFSEDVDKLVIDDPRENDRLLRFMDTHMPALKEKVEFYQGKEPIFDAYGIEDEIRRAQQRKVWLKSGGYLIIDQAEALTAIDVNSGRYIGKKNLEETITKINIEAAEEVVYQLRLRNIGGIIILDFIDMEKSSNREKVYRSLEDALRKDKAKTNILKISDLGLIEMTRKRVRESLTRMMHEPCPYCDGRGLVKTNVTVGYEVLRDAMRESAHRHEDSVFVNCASEVAGLLTTVERDALRYTMDRSGKKLVIKAQEGYHREQYDLYSKNTGNAAASSGAGNGSPAQSQSQPQAGGGRPQAESSASGGGQQSRERSSRRRRRRRGRGRRDQGGDDQGQGSGGKGSGGKGEGKMVAADPGSGGGGNE